MGRSLSFLSLVGMGLRTCNANDGVGGADGRLSPGGRAQRKQLSARLTGLGAGPAAEEPFESPRTSPTRLAFARG
jgi:broad specificity phosphatase PhoE